MESKHTNTEQTEKDKKITETIVYQIGNNKELNTVFL